MALIRNQHSPKLILRAWYIWLRPLSPHFLGGWLLCSGECVSGDSEVDNEWAIISGMRRDAKLDTEEDGGSRENIQLTLASTATAGGRPDDAAMRMFFKYNGEYHR